MTFPWRRGVLVCGLAGWLGACATTQPSVPAPTAFADATPVTSTTAVTASAASAAALVDTSIDYHIGPEDIIDVSVYQVPDLTTEAQVSESGQITLPLLGQVMASGKTAMQLQSDIASQLGAKYLQSPQVTVTIKDMQSQRVTIEGAVSKPGIYPTNGKTTLLQMIALSGGLGDTAQENGIVILRTVNGQREAAKFDYGAIRSGKSADPVLLASDVVVVDTSGLKTAWADLRASLPVFGFFRPYL